jgi:SAM-dependent methyltransferase
MEYLVLRLESLLAPLIYRMNKIFAPNGLPQSSFERLYRRPDPWHYLTSPYEQGKQNRALELLGSAGNAKRDRALEVGCSEGAFTEKLAARDVAGQVVGVDISSLAIARARERCARFDNVTFLNANILESAPEGHFDLVFVMEILYYLGRDLRRVCEQLGPHLADGCRVILMHGWPVDIPLHRSFQELLGLQVLSEHVEKNAARPYVVTLLEKASATAGVSKEARLPSQSGL